ncbi:unnamed protein product [Rhizophagus irregularis]|uniref:Uncharacterized protein n=1 Tax=Rhizophagus irregularis TaxID=588596 RepID=A0A915YY15_9GLOM|nr:unnamed protein product [Rhizophagus irregularis]CAB5352195.1 unnamed protein product [Rhizophagus irregularis]
MRLKNSPLVMESVTCCLNPSFKSYIGTQRGERKETDQKKKPTLQFILLTECFKEGTVLKLGRFSLSQKGTSRPN